MSSQIESGINTYVGHFGQLINVCESFGSRYNPIPEALKIDSLRGQLFRVQGVITAVDNALATFLTAVSARQEKFTLLPPLAIRVQAEAIILGLPDSVVVHIKEVVRKIHGRRARAIKPLVNDNSNPVPTKHISVSQMSFNEQIEHLNQLLALVVSQAAYKPAESDLTAAALNGLLSAMRSTNEAVMVVDASLTAARQERDRQLYTPKTGMIDTALTVKEYVKAVFGASSQQYKAVHHIKFENRKL
jgi:hypothetical protein